MRFTSGPNKNQPLPEGVELRRMLEAEGVVVTPAPDPGLADRAQEIATAISRCDLFVVFGTSDYGVDTGNPMCSYQEFKFARCEGKPIAHIKMCDALRGGKGQAYVDMQLAGIIYKHVSEGLPAVCTWVLQSLGLRRQGS